MLVNGRRCTVVGRVFLNVATMYVTDLPGKVWRRGEELIFEEIVPLFDGVHIEINLMAGNFNEVRYLD